MALATRCPACSTIFRISTAQAAAKGGMVRCGQCRNVFNSLDALVRVEDLEVIDEVVVEPPMPMGGAPSDEPVAATLDDEPAPAAGIDRVAAEPAEVASDALPEAAPAAEPPSATISEWWLPEPGTAPPPVEGVDDRASAGLRDDAGQLLSDRRTDLPVGGTLGDARAPGFLQPEPATGGSRAGRWAYAALSLVALLALLGQAAYLWRDEIASSWLPSRPWLAAACAPLRCRVEPPLHLDSITIESAAIVSSDAAPNVYVLTALLRNRDVVDVRHPHLALVLTDLQDRPILRRALRPEDYLPTGSDVPALVSAGFGPDRELPIRITFELTDLRFAGYRLDKFYP